MAPADSLNSLYDENNDNMQLQSHPSVGGRESINWVQWWGGEAGWHPEMSIQVGPRSK